MSGWEIATVVVLLVTAVIGIVLLFAYLVEAERKIPPSKQGPSLPPIVFRPTPIATLKPQQVTVRSVAPQQNIKPRQLDFGTDGHHIEKREIKEDLDIYCKFTGRIVRQCRCADCRELRAGLGN